MKFNIVFTNVDGAGFMRDKRPWTSQVNPMLDPLSEYDEKDVDAEVKRLQEQAETDGNVWGYHYKKVRAHS